MRMLPAIAIPAPIKLMGTTTRIVVLGLLVLGILVQQEVALPASCCTGNSVLIGYGGIRGTDVCCVPQRRQSACRRDAPSRLVCAAEVVRSGRTTHGPEAAALLEDRGSLLIHG